MNTLVSPDVLRDFNFGNKPTAKNVSFRLFTLDMMQIISPKVD